MFIKEFIYKYFVLKHTRVKNLKIYRPTQSFISRDAIFNISKSLCVNKPSDGYRGTSSYFKVSSGATINCQRFDFFQCSVCLYDNAVLNFGDNSYMNHGGAICCQKSITIGNDTIIGTGVKIRDTDNHTIIGKEMASPIVIGNHVWIGVNVIILKGVTIGDGAVVAAGSVVVHDVPSRCLVAGVPAKVVREDVEWQR